jgi:hypothetical protein
MKSFICALEQIKEKAGRGKGEKVCGPWLSWEGELGHHRGYP